MNKASTTSWSSRTTGTGEDKISSSDMMLETTLRSKISLSKRSEVDGETEPEQHDALSESQSTARHSRKAQTQAIQKQCKAKVQGTLETAETWSNKKTTKNDAHRMEPKRKNWRSDVQEQTSCRTTVEKQRWASDEKEQHAAQTV